MTNGIERKIEMNKNLLKSKMILNNDNNKTLAEKLKITSGTFSSKLNNKNNFTLKEMNYIRVHYKLSDREFIEIFIE